jgi:hypothetical protein
MKRFKQWLSVLLAMACITLLSGNTLAASAENFTDCLETKWYYTYIDYAAQKNLVNGTTSTTFSPSDSMTRGQFVTIIGRMAGVSDLPTTSNSDYLDLRSGAYYEKYVNWASAMGIVKGTASGIFQPDAAITREQMATIVYRFVKTYGAELPADSTAIVSFKDSTETSAYAREAVEALRKAGLLRGDQNGNVHPADPMTRAEGTAVLVRLDKLSIIHGHNYICTDHKDKDISAGDNGYNVYTCSLCSGTYKDIIPAPTVIDTEFYSVELPGVWADYCDYEISQNANGTYSLSFYEKESHSTYAGGHLFTISLEADEMFTHMPAYQHLGELHTPQADLFDMIAWFPTDVQFIPERQLQYTAMQNGIPFILKTITPASGCTLPTSAAYSAYKQILLNYSFRGDVVYLPADLNGDGVKELFLKAGSYEAEYVMDIYTFENGHAVFMGQLSAGHSSFVFCRTGEVYQLYGHMGYASLSQVLMDGGIISSKEIYPIGQYAYADGGYTELNKFLESKGIADVFESSASPVFDYSLLRSAMNT